MEDKFHDVTVAEVYRTLLAFQRDVKEDIHEVQNRIDRLNFVDEGVYLAEREALRTRVTALESTNRWIIRAFGGTLIGLIMVALFTFQTGGPLT